ncbi:hypothetical protein HHX47_DHR5000764 [Lentinula edodes]|nr:hypothetical protein HHX47_DHR5000764 [Lentinula edodes]
MEIIGRALYQTRIARHLSSGNIYCVLLTVVRSSWCFDKSILRPHNPTGRFSSRKGTRGGPRKILLACLVLLLLTYTWAFVVKCAANLVNIQAALVQNQSGGDLTTQIDNAAIAVLPYQYMIAWPVTLNVTVNIVDCIFDDIALKSFWATSAWDTAAAFLSFGLNLVATLLIALRVW